MAGISCPSCGGKMVFDIPNQNLKCSSCGNSIEVSEYKQNNEAEEQQETYNTMVYTCRNCGAELIAPDEQTVAYCSYCGSEATLDGKYEEVLRPKKILPFLKTKKQAKNAYEAAVKGKLYVPKDFKDADFLQEFRGVYLPYYSYQAVIPSKNLQLEGSKHYTKSGYDYSETYLVDAEIGGVTGAVKYDASVAFDDTIANEIAPFNTKDERPFNEAYLAGFYADKATTDVSTYIQDATEEAIDSVYDRIEAKCAGVNVKGVKSMEAKKEEVGIDSFQCDVTMYPIWFLTWKNKNRVAYSVMNGQTGKIAVDIPVDKKKFILVSLIAAAIIFVILSVIPVFILPKALSSLSAIILAVSTIIFSREIKRIYERETHIYDYGDVSHTEEKKRIKPNQKSALSKMKKPIGSALGCGIVIVLYVGVYAVIGIISIIAVAVEGLSLSAGHTFCYIVMLVIQVILSFKTARRTLHLDKKSALIPSLAAPVALFFGLWVGIVNPAHDYWYYGTALACLICLVLNGLSAINYFNFLTTRPVPNFFRREGADHAL